MKTRFLLPLLLLLHLALLPALAQEPASSKEKKEKKKEATVYICDSKTASVYHSGEGCRGLNNCKHEIIEVTKKDAVNVYGRRACKICC